MITERHRQILIFGALSVTLLAGVMYDTLLVQERERLQLLLVALTAAGFAAVFVLQRYPAKLISPVLFSNWPLHLFTLCFFWICFAFHGGSMLHQVIVYTLFAYATYVLVPFVFLCDRQMFDAYLKLVSVVCALLTVPALVGAMGYDRLLIFPLRIKPSYAEFSGIIATGGILEHAEGFAFQVAIGMICSLYIAQTRRSWLYSFCFLVNLIGLIVSQGRAAIYGVGVAVAFLFLPHIFRRSRPVFLGTLAFFLTFPFFIWPQLGSVPGLSGYLRIERGLSGRDEAWRFALSVIREKPWTGHGFMASAELTESEQKLLRTSGFSGAGTTFHNTYITKAVDLGLIATFIYSLLYLWPLARICQPTAHAAEDALLRSMLILVVTTAIFRDYNIGGIRSTAMAGSIFLGLANLRHLAAQCEDENMAVAPAGSTAGVTATACKSPIEVRRTAF